MWLWLLYVTREVAGFSSFPTNAEYMATYTYVNQGYDMIESVYNTLFRAGAGSVTDKQNAVVSQRVENSSKWARAYCSWTWVSYGGAFSYDHVLRFFVGKDTYSVSLVY
ncbi:hypothetical protein [Baia soyae]|uniref:hypothetical protein n=1 Tax=Baia soyae TaxID=1544746 RepID=UPI00104FC691|nr:hypothetical protein [Baia soyae]